MLTLLLALSGASAKAAQIIQDTFTAADGTALLGHSPDTNLPGGAYVGVPNPGSGYSDGYWQCEANWAPGTPAPTIIRSGQVCAYIDAQYTLPLGSYGFQKQLTISADLTVNGLIGGYDSGTGREGGITLGLSSSTGAALPGITGNSIFQFLTGLNLRDDGTLSLYDKGTPSNNGIVGSVAWSGAAAFDKTQAYHLSYDVDTTTGALSNIQLQGSTADYSSLEGGTRFIYAGNPYLGMYFGSAPTGWPVPNPWYGSIDNLSVVGDTGPTDTTPPEWVVNWPKADTVTSTGFTARAQINENGKAYYAVLTAGSPDPTAADVAAGTGALKNGSINLTGNAEATSVVTGLTPETAYDVWFVAEDTVPNLQATPVKVSITTTTAPVAYGIILDTFTADDGTAAIGRSPAPTNLPGGAWAGPEGYWQVGDCGWAGGPFPTTIASNKLRAFIDMECSVSLAGASAQLTIAADLTVNGLFGTGTDGTGRVPGITLGLNTASGGSERYLTLTGLNLRENGTLHLFDKGTVVASVPWSGAAPFDKTQAYHLSYDVDTTSGALSNIQLQGSTADYSSLEGGTRFAYASTPYASMYFGIHPASGSGGAGWPGNAATAFGYVDNFSVEGYGSTPATSPFDDWVGPFFPDVTDPLIVGQAADPDGDNQNNLMEFALGGTPNNGALNAKVYSYSGIPANEAYPQAEPKKVLILTIAVLDNTPTFTSATQVDAMDGVRYTIEGGTTLGDWSGLNVFPIPYEASLAVLPTAGTGYHYQSFVLTGTEGLPGKAFMRVRVEPLAP